MGYQVVDPETVTPVDGRPCELRRLSAATELSNIATNKFRAEPGEQLPLAYHYHESQQEAFYILHGMLYVKRPHRQLLLRLENYSPLIQRVHNEHITLVMPRRM